MTAPTAPAALLAGRYRLRERLGAGGFGVVWRAEDELLHREVALKRIALPPAAVAATAGGHELQAGERARREALAAARLSHPAIVALYEVHVEHDAVYLVSELVRGATLARLIAQDALSDEQVLEIGLALTGALAHAHARGVIHRDVKPQNVLVPRERAEREAPAKLTDFGGASVIGEEGLTRTGETLGTLAYMAPEQSEGSAIDERVDVYSLALVLYEALSGVNPVRGATPAATARRIGRPVAPLHSERPDLSAPLCDALDRALQVQREQRGTLADLHATLERAVLDGPTQRRRLLAPRARARHGHGPAPGVDAGQAPVDAAVGAPDPVAAFAPSEPRAQPAAAVGESPATGLGTLPRALWLGAVLALAVWQAVTGRPGLALLILTLGAPLLGLARRTGPGWLSAALAPALGLVGLAGAYPAIAGQAREWRARAALGALGYWWLVLGAALLARSARAETLWLRPPAGLPERSAWEGSLHLTATHVIGPALTVGLVLGCALWAVGAAVLPLLVRGRSAILDALGAVAWSAGLLLAAPRVDVGLAPVTHLQEPRGAVLGAIVGCAIAVAARALRGPV